MLKCSLMFPNIDTYNFIYSQITDSLYNGNSFNLKLYCPFEERTKNDMKVYIKYSHIHNQFFGRMSSEDGDSRAFMLNLKYYDESYDNNNYVNYRHEFKRDGVTFYCNIYGWFDPKTESFNKMNQYIN